MKSFVIDESTLNESFGGAGEDADLYTEISYLAAFMGGAFSNYPRVVAHLTASRKDFSAEQYKDAALQDLLIISMSLQHWIPNNEIVQNVTASFLSRIGATLFTPEARKQMLLRMFSTTKEIEEGKNESS